MKDRAYRMRMYFFTMTVRMACVISLFWVRGPWIILVAIGAIVLPYVAVLIANAVSYTGGQAHEAPSPHELTSAATPTTPSELDTPSTPIVIVVDAPVHRRAHDDGEAT